MMLLMIGAYTVIMRAGASVIVVAAGFGATMSTAIAILWWSRVRERRLAVGAILTRSNS
jgi:hypothetical protein